MRIDLHLHTNASDGQHTPTELIDLVRQQHLDVIAITDHDTTGGIAEAQSVSQGHPQIIPGIELSAEDEEGDVHVLGYFIDPANTALQEKLSHFRTERLERGQRIVQKLIDLGIPVTWDRVSAIAGDASIGRPHIARALLEAGHVDSVHDAFDRYLYNGGPAYVARYRLTPEEAIQFIHSAGGVAVLAHPGLLPDYRAMVQRLVPAGLDGVEVYHPENSQTVRLNLSGLAQQYDLVVTGGSDFHGQAIKANARPGMTDPPPACVRALRERAARYAGDGNSAISNT
ncbi:MAG: PHP domain-containing protein [Anaerolineae bacterium]|nr:PHP domain-containing protein [Anaerolineae bacterium]